MKRPSADDEFDVVHDLGHGDTLMLITCKFCYCAVVARFFDKHIETQHKDIS